MKRIGMILDISKNREEHCKISVKSKERSSITTPKRRRRARKRRREDLLVEMPWTWT
jgi:hypothetical protein